MAVHHKHLKIKYSHLDWTNITQSISTTSYTKPKTFRGIAFFTRKAEKLENINVIT